MLKNDARCCFHAAAGIECANLSRPSVSDMGVITFAEMRSRRPLSPLLIGAKDSDAMTRIGIHFMILHSVAFLGLHPAEAFEQLRTADVPAEVLKESKDGIFGGRQFSVHNPFLRHLLAFCEPLNGVRAPHVSSQFLGAT